MKFTIEEERRGDVVTRVYAVTTLPNGQRFELSMPAQDAEPLRFIATACNAHEQLVEALKEANDIVESKLKSMGDVGMTEAILRQVKSVAASRAALIAAGVTL